MEMLALINGKKVKKDEWVNIISPLDNKTIVGKVPALKTDDINLAYISAAKVQKEWENAGLNYRIKIMKKFRDLLFNNKEKLANIISLEIAKANNDALTEVIRSIEYIDYTIEEVIRLHPQTFTGNDGNKIGIFKRVAKGIVLAISPFNYPVNLSISKIVPALLTGNSVIFKPATQGSLSGLFLADLLLQAKVPDGVFNAISGRGRDIGDILVAHPLINVISFTGSVEVGKNLVQKSGKVDLILELGGKDPALVTNNCDLLLAAKEIVKGAYSYNGQRCTAIKRVLVLDSVADQLVKLMKNEIEKLSVGKPNDNCNITPMIDKKSADFVSDLIKDALAKKATLVIGNKREDNLFWPTLIDNVNETMDLCWKEPFGPVLPIIRLKSVNEMITLVNKSNFGLQASIFTNDLNEAFVIADQLNVGSVNINGQPARGPDYFPFTGIKDSGLGVQGISESILSMTRPKGYIFNIKK